MFFVYMLECADGRYDTGHTENPEGRLARHVSGRGGDFTCKRLPVRLVFSDVFPSRPEAPEAGHRIKGWTRAKTEALIAGDFSKVARLAKRQKP